MNHTLLIESPPDNQQGQTPRRGRLGPLPHPRHLRMLGRIALLLLILAFCLGSAAPPALGAGKTKPKVGTGPTHPIETLVPTVRLRSRQDAVDTRPPPPTDCPDPLVLGEALALVVEANPVLGAERDQLAERARQKGWESYLSLGYSTNTSFESGEAGANAALRVRIPLFDRKQELALAEARTALSKSQDALLSAFLAEVRKLCDQGARVQEADTLRGFYRDRLKYRQERVDEGLEEAPVLWAESEQVQKSEHAWRREAQALNAQGLTLARQYGGAEWRRLQALLGAMRR